MGTRVLDADPFGKKSLFDFHWLSQKASFLQFPRFVTCVCFQNSFIFYCMDIRCGRKMIAVLHEESRGIRRSQGIIVQVMCASMGCSEVAQAGHGMDVSAGFRMQIV